MLNENYSNIRKNPILRILIPFIIGILIASSYKEYLLDLTVILFLLFFLGTCILFFISKTKLKALADFIISITILSLAISITLYATKVPTNFEKKCIWNGIIYENPLLKNNSILLPIKISSANFPKNKLLKPQKVYLYTNLDSTLLKNILIGDIISFKAKLKIIKNAGNPHEFNYSRYLSLKGVNFQSFAKADNISITPSNKFWLKKTTRSIQSKALQKLNSFIVNKDAFAIISALALGEKTYISDELKQSYINAGAIHVLAISGLHVGIIFLLLNYLLSFLKDNRRNKIAKTIIIISCIWIFALITGSSSSVIRASIMFSFISIGKISKRNQSIYNNLAAAALLMLVINPLQLFNIGFQLSFIAVAGIVYFQPIFYNWIHINNKILDKAYQLFTVSLAAQLVTTPLSLHYFNQFPTYFWLTNILLIPLVAIAITLAIAILSLSWIPKIAMGLSFVLEHILIGTNIWIEFIEQLPHSSIQNINISPINTLILITTLILATIWLKHKKNQFVIYILLALLIGGLLNSKPKTNKNNIIVYNLRNTDIIGIYTNSQNLLVYNCSQQELKTLQKFYFKKHWLKLGLKKTVSTINFSELKTLINQSNQESNNKLINIKLSKNNNFLIWDKPEQRRFPERIYSNYLYICENIWPPASKISSKTIILGNNLNYKTRQAWIKYAELNKINTVKLSENGAYKIEF